MFRGIYLAIAFLAVCLLIAGCSADGKPPGWTMVSRASWETNFNGLYFADENSGWAVGDMGIIAHTSDGGVTWTAQKSHTEIFLRSVYFVDNKRGWIVGDSGLILRTEDGGKTWSPQKSTTIG